MYRVCFLITRPVSDASVLTRNWMIPMRSYETFSLEVLDLSALEYIYNTWSRIYLSHNIITLLPYEVRESCSSRVTCSLAPTAKRTTSHVTPVSPIESGTGAYAPWTCFVVDIDANFISYLSLFFLYSYAHSSRIVSEP
jgi:hypothetical protein